MKHLINVKLMFRFFMPVYAWCLTPVYSADIDVLHQLNAVSTPNPVTWLVEISPWMKCEAQQNALHQCVRVPPEKQSITRVKTHLRAALKALPDHMSLSLSVMGLPGIDLVEENRILGLQESNDSVHPDAHIYQRNYPIESSEYDFLMNQVNGEKTLDQSTLDISKAAHVSVLRFKEIDIPQGVVIESARLHLATTRHRPGDADLATLDIRMSHAQSHGIVEDYLHQPRLKSQGEDMSLSLVLDPFDDGAHLSLDVSDLVREFFSNQSQQKNPMPWCAGDDLVFYFSGDGGRGVYTYEKGGNDAPRLEVKFRVPISNQDRVNRCQNTDQQSDTLLTNRQKIDNTIRNLTLDQQDIGPIGWRKAEQFFKRFYSDHSVPTKDTGNSCELKSNLVWIMRRPNVEKRLADSLQALDEHARDRFVMDIIGYGERTDDQVLAFHTMSESFGGDYFAVDPGLSVNHILQVSVAANNRNGSVVNTGFATSFSDTDEGRQLYYSFAQLNGEGAWLGNVKRYQLKPSEYRGMASGTILDADGRLATEEINETSVIKSDARSWWTDPDLGGDGQSVFVGGLVDRLGKNIAYTYLGEYQTERLNGWASIPVRPSIARFENRLNSRLANIPKIRSLLSADSDFLTDQSLAILLDWVAGSDVEATMPKKTMGANLHGGLALIDYGNESEQEAYHTLFFSTTEGFLHAFNVQPSDSRLKHDDSYSLELFRFIPQELLKSSIQQWAHVSGLMRMPDFDHGNQSSEHKGGFSYGLDGPLTVWKHDAFKEQINGDYAGYALQDGIIEAQSRPTFPDSDLVFIYAGMRRGGHHLYALDVTSVSTSQAVNTLDPRLMFVIKGGKDAPKGSPYLQLGQTWSKPALGRIKVNGEVKPVLVIGGGYDADLYDQGFGKTNIGNQVYIIDAQTGYLYWAASSNFNSSATSSGLHKVPGMEYAIPSEIKVVDSDADGLTDLLYFGDLGGQLWRVKINARYDPDEKGFAKATPILKAGLTWQHQVKQDRRFFYPPSVSFMGAGVYAVSMVSGNPAAPFERSVQDGLFVVYDKPNGEIDQAGLDVCDLYLHKASKQDSTNCNADTAKKGWKLMFDQTLGERAVGTPIVFNHNLFFATFLPPEKAQGRLRQCEITLGSSRVYGLNIRAEYIDQPSGYFQRYELVKKNEFHLATRPTSRFAQSLRYIIRKKGRSVSSLSLLVGNKLIAELEMPKARITKVRWVPGGRY